MKQVELITH